MGKTRPLVASWANHKIKEALREKTVYIANLPGTTSEDELRLVFGQCGEIVKVSIARNANGNLKGYAFVDYTNKESCTMAINAQNKNSFKGQEIQVSMAKPPKPKIAENKFGNMGYRTAYGYGYGGYNAQNYGAYAANVNAMNQMNYAYTQQGGAY